VKKTLLVIGGLVVIGLLFFGQLMSMRNDLVRQREAINGAWAQVDVVLKRRADLIPNLVETVKGFAKQEQGIIDSVTKARAALVGARDPAGRIAASQQLDSALARLLVVVENYPQLKSNENFLRLQDELAGTENRIAQERKKYNDAVQQYNVTVELFPNNIAAALFGFQRSDAFFRTDPAAREVPAVKF
jgi:LemA protein